MKLQLIKNNYFSSYTFRQGFCLPVELADNEFLDIICTAQARGRLIRGSAYMRVCTIITNYICFNFT